MDGGAWIVHLIGFPAAGKLTVAQAIAAAASSSGQRWVVVDNHLTSDVIFSVLDVDGVSPLPAGVWDRVDDVREAIFRTIEELSPRSWSFVFTNVLIEESPGERARLDRVVALAEHTGRRYLPVIVHCDEATLVSRVANPDRAERKKWRDPEGVRAYLRTHQLLAIDDLSPLTVDTSVAGPQETAAAVLAHLADRG